MPADADGPRGEGGRRGGAGDDDDRRARSDSSPTRVARAVLPTLDDLLDDGWLLDDDDDPVGDDDDDDDGRDAIGWGLPDACLPARFPDASVVDGEDVAFVRPGDAGVYALSLVMADGASTALAWSVLIDAAFVRCFIASIAAETAPLDDAVLLGPVMDPSGASIIGGVGVHVATFSNATPHAVAPILVRYAAATAGTVVVVVVAVDRGDAAAGRRWDHLVERVAARGQATLG